LVFVVPGQFLVCRPARSQVTHCSLDMLADQAGLPTQMLCMHVLTRNRNEALCFLTQYKENGMSTLSNKITDLADIELAVQHQALAASN